MKLTVYLLVLPATWFFKRRCFVSICTKCRTSYGPSQIPMQHRCLLQTNGDMRLQSLMQSIMFDGDRPTRRFSDLKPAVQHWRQIQRHRRLASVDDLCVGPPYAHEKLERHCNSHGVRDFSMRTLFFIIALGGVAWSLLMVNQAMPGLMASPSAIRRREAVSTADQLLASAKASGQTNVVISAQVLQPIISGTRRSDARTTDLESGLLVSAGIVFVLSIGLLVTTKRRA